MTSIVIVTVVVTGLVAVMWLFARAVDRRVKHANGKTREQIETSLAACRRSMEASLENELTASEQRLARGLTDLRERLERDLVSLITAQDELRRSLGGHSRPD